MPVDFRVAIGTPDCLRSTVWRGASHKNDVYVSHSDMGKVQKFSFHKSLKCRLAFHENTKPSGMDDRVIEKWLRAPTPMNGVAYALVAIFPTDTLSTALAPEDKEVMWIPAARAGGTVVLEFLFTRDSVENTDAFARQNNRSLINYTTLPNGDAFVLTMTTGKWTGEDFLAPSLIVEDAQYVVSRDDPDNTGRPARFTTFNQPKAGMPMEVWEYGAYRVPLDAVFAKPMGRFTRTKLLHRSTKKSSDV